MGKLTIKGKHTLKIGNHLHTNVITQPAIMRRGEYKCQTMEMHLKLRDWQLKTSVCVHTHTHTRIVCIYIYTLTSEPQGSPYIYSINCYIKTSW